MLSFTLTKSKNNLEEQWTNLYRIGQDKDWETLLFRFFPLFLVTVLYGLFYWITPVNDYIKFKVVTISLIAIAWGASVVFIPIHFIIEKKRRKRNFKELMEMIPDSGLSYAVQITEEKVTLVSSDETHEFPWSVFTSFGIYQETIYVFNTLNSMNSLFLGKNEMENEVWTGLHELLEKKAIKQAF